MTKPTDEIEWVARAIHNATAQETDLLWDDCKLARFDQARAAIAAMDPERLLVEETAYRAAAEIISLREQVAAMREALEPFAREAEDWPDKPDYEELSSAFDLRFVDLRRARAALKEGPME